MLFIFLSMVYHVSSKSSILSWAKGKNKHGRWGSLCSGTAHSCARDVRTRLGRQRMESITGSGRLQVPGHSLGGGPMEACLEPHRRGGQQTWGTEGLGKPAACAGDGSHLCGTPSPAQAHDGPPPPRSTGALSCCSRRPCGDG